MKDLVIMCLTCAILAGQYQLGLRRKKLFGAMLPAILIAVFTALSLAVRTLALLPIGLACIAAVVAIWCIPRHANRAAGRAVSCPAGGPMFYLFSRFQPAPLSHQPPGSAWPGALPSLF